MTVFDLNIFVTSASSLCSRVFADYAPTENLTPNEIQAKLSYDQNSIGYADGKLKELAENHPKTAYIQALFCLYQVGQIKRSASKEEIVALLQEALVLFNQATLKKNQKTLATLIESMLRIDDR